MVNSTRFLGNGKISLFTLAEEYKAQATNKSGRKFD